MGSFLVFPRETVGKHLVYLGSSHCGLHCPSLWLLVQKQGVIVDHEDSFYYQRMCHCGPLEACMGLRKGEM